jgi:hypothetical protein
MMTNRNLIFAGSGLLAVGLFLPIVTLPILGTVNLFGNGGNLNAIALLVLAALAGGLALKDRLAEALWPGLGAAGILLYGFVRLQYAISQMRASLDDLADNPFAGLVQGAMSSVQLQWGWLILAAGVGLIIYGAFRSRPPGKLFVFPDKIARGVAAASAAALLIAPGMDLIGTIGAKDAATPDDVATARGPAVDAPAAGAGNEARVDQEEAAYIARHLQVYELNAKYFDSILDGRVPGVTFKVKNNGDRTLNRVKVRVVFQDAEGNPIAEEEYTPVLVSSYSYGDGNRPLRPNYISQQDRGNFWAAKSVPSEWQAGRAVATITEIEFAPEGDVEPAP